MRDREYISTESERAYRKRYYAANRDRILARRRERYQENRERENMASKVYAINHDRSQYFRARYEAKRGAAHE